MKLVIVVIHDEDAHTLMDALSKASYMSTKLASTGGLLKTGNTTIFIGIDDEKVTHVIEIIKQTCKTKKELSLINPPTSAMREGYVPLPIEVTVGGATIFVVDIDQYLKI